jgi:hypothetical protein
MHPDTTKLLHSTLERQAKQTKAAYYAGIPGVTYEDMSAAARRLLEMRVAIEKATGRPVRTKVTKASVATLLRSL